MKRIVGLVALFSLVTLANCGGGDGAGNASCRGILKKYDACGVYSGGVNNCHAEPEREYDQCFAACVQDATCQQIEDYVCGGDTTTCMNLCAAEDLICRNGRHVDALDECDGFDDCGDESDENGCQLSIFRCAVQGEEIPGGQVCDGEINCANGADEEDCGQYHCF